MPLQSSKPLSNTSDPLSIVHDRPSYSKTNSSKSQHSADLNLDERLSGLYRAGRIFASIFDRGRHMNYEYHITGDKSNNARSKKRNSLEIPHHLDNSHHTSAKSSRASSMADVSPANSRRSSSQSTTGRRERRGGMSMSVS